MSLKRTWYDINLFLSRYLTPAAKYLLLANTAVFLIQILILPFLNDSVKYYYRLYLAEIPRLAVYHFMLWQFVTYMFIHGDILHFVFNMFILWFFAPRLEWLWGTVSFLKFYFIVGIGAGIFHAVVSIVSGRMDEGIIGASGALYGILLASALYWPNDMVLLYGIFPIKIKHLVIGLGILTFVGSLSSNIGGISHITHLGGLIVAYLYLRGPRDFKQLILGRRRPSRYRDSFSDRGHWR